MEALLAQQVSPGHVSARRLGVSNNGLSFVLDLRPGIHVADMQRIVRCRDVAFSSARHLDWLAKHRLSLRGTNTRPSVHIEKPVLLHVQWLWGLFVPHFHWKTQVGTYHIAP